MKCALRTRSTLDLKEFAWPSNDVQEPRLPRQPRRCSGTAGPGRRRRRRPDPRCPSVPPSGASDEHPSHYDHHHPTRTHPPPRGWYPHHPGADHPDSHRHHEEAVNHPHQRRSRTKVPARLSAGTFMRDDPRRAATATPTRQAGRQRHPSTQARRGWPGHRQGRKRNADAEGNPCPVMLVRTDGVNWWYRGDDRPPLRECEGQHPDPRRRGGQPRCVPDTSGADTSPARPKRRQPHIGWPNPALVPRRSCPVLDQTSD